MTPDKTLKALVNLYEHSKTHPLYDRTLFRREKIVIYRGNLNKPKYLFIGEAPGKTEAQKGEPFVGNAGKLLNKWLAYAAITDYCIINAMTLLPLDNDGNIRKPYATEIHFFRPYISKLIQAIEPEYIILLGKTATECFDIPWKPLKWQGTTGIIYHPAYYLRGNREQGYEDFKNLIESQPKKRNI